MPIPWTAIQAYGSLHRFTGEAFDDLLIIIRAMDKAYVRRAHEMIEDESGNS